MSRHIKEKAPTRADAHIALDAPIDMSQLAAEATRLFGGDAPIAISYCGLDAWLDGDAQAVRMWAKVFNRLKA